MNLVYLSWKNMWNKSWSSILSIILIAFGVGLLSLMILFQNQFSEQFEKNQAGIDMVLGAKGSPLQLILNAMFHVDAPTGNIKIGDAKFAFNPKHPFIEDAIPLSLGDSYKTFRIVGTNHDILKLYPTKIKEGSLWKNGMEVTIGEQVARETGLKIGDHFFSSHGYNAGDLEHDDVEPFVVSGVFEYHGSVIDKLILVSNQAIWKVHEGHSHEEDNNEIEDTDPHALHNHDHTEDVSEVKESILDYPEKSITSILVRFKKGKKTSIPVINMPRNINENTPIMATSPTYQLNKLIANVGSALKAISYLALLIAIVSGLSIFISLFNNLKDRKHELAMMRVAGGKPIQLFKVIIFEALIIGLIGGFVGLVLAHGAMMVISGLLDSQFHYGLSPWKLYKMEFLVFFVTLVISFIAGLLPAWRAYRTNIIENLI